MATWGITAGAGFATVELELLLYDTILGMHNAWAPMLVIKVFVDDITLAVCGLPQRIIRILIEALDFLVTQLEVELRMQVSDSKSKVLAGRPSIAAAVRAGINNDRLSFTRRGKLLGTDTVGGRRRTTVTFLQRVQTFSEARPKLQSLRQSGVNSVQMVRAAGTPAIMYGCEVMGLSDSALHLARSRIASAASAPTGGKNPELLMYIIDGPFGTLDPAFEAHAAPVLLWAIAVWHAWFSRQQFEQAFQQASFKLATKEGDSCWCLVTGPMTALLASLKRIGWLMPNAFEVVDDLGTTWYFGVDSPGAIAAACKDAVRRWRLKRVGTILPGLIPDKCDVGSPHCPEGTVLVDFTVCSHPYMHGVGKGARKDETWDPVWKHSLVSAAVAGQWPQARKPAVAQWAIEDNKCQLCKERPGTLEHRFHCDTTLPIEGWPEPPKLANLAMARLSQVRRDHLRHYGLLVLRLPAPPVIGDGFFKWLLKPTTALVDGAELCWHFDGSMLHGDWKTYRTTGYGVVVTLANGRLIGHGHGKPPHWCRTAAAAEAWALHQVMSESEFLPGMRTDCLSLIATAAAGVTKATDPRKVLARTWAMIAHILDGDLQQIADHSTLVWMPAHSSPASIGEVKMSNGASLTHIDWRANRLANGLAKLAAAEHSPPKAILRLLKSAKAAVEHCAKLLGRVTYAANNHVVLEPDQDGKLVSRTLRDSVEAPKRARVNKQASSKPCAKPLAKTKLLCEVKPWTPPSAGTRKLSGDRHWRQQLALRETALLERRVQEVGDRLRPSSQRPADERLHQLRQRVLRSSFSE